LIWSGRAHPGDCTATAVGKSHMRSIPRRAGNIPKRATRDIPKEEKCRIL
jgi:hypothetical protein